MSVILRSLLAMSAIAATGCTVLALPPADLSPAEKTIAAAQKAIADNPKNVDAYNRLALGLARRARETSDDSFYNKADDAIVRSLELAPDNFEAQKMRVWVLLGKHEFQQALDVAGPLNKKMPDDLLVYGFLTDANAELGNYAEAEKACQWMLDLRPGNIPAFTRAAYLRELFGDIEGAIELMSKAYERTPLLEIEDRAWILTQLGHLEFVAGRNENAEQLLQQALKLFPNYHYALGNLARLRSAQNKHGDAVDLLKRRYDAAPHPENLYALAEELDRAGHQAEAKAAFVEFETRALKESSKWDNSNRELVFYYANHAHKPADALRIAQLEIARRHDVYTLDVYAWALHVNDRNSEAIGYMNLALAVGTKDPEVLKRAAVIGSKSPISKN